MRKNTILSKQIIKAITVGLSASMMLQPVAAFADELPEGTGTNDDSTSTEQATEEVAKDSASEAREKLEGVADDETTEENEAKAGIIDELKAEDLNLNGQHPSVVVADSTEQELAEDIIEEAEEIDGVKDKVEDALYDATHIKRETTSTTTTTTTTSSGSSASDTSQSYASDTSESTVKEEWDDISDLAEYANDSLQAIVDEANKGKDQQEEVNAPVAEAEATVDEEGAPVGEKSAYEVAKEEVDAAVADIADALVDKEGVEEDGTATLAKNTTDSVLENLQKANDLINGVEDDETTEEDETVIGAVTDLSEAQKQAEAAKVAAESAQEIEGEAAAIQTQAENILSNEDKTGVEDLIAKAQAALDAFNNNTKNLTAEDVTSPSEEVEDDEAAKAAKDAAVEAEKKEIMASDEADAVNKAVEAAKAAVDKANTDIAALESQYKEKKLAYEGAQAQYKLAQDAYDKAVASYNAKAAEINKALTAVAEGAGLVAGAPVSDEKVLVADDLLVDGVLVREAIPTPDGIPVPAEDIAADAVVVEDATDPYLAQLAEKVANLKKAAEAAEEAFRNDQKNLGLMIIKAEEEKIQKQYEDSYEAYQANPNKDVVAWRDKSKKLLDNKELGDDDDDTLDNIGGRYASYFNKVVEYYYIPVLKEGTLVSMEWKADQNGSYKNPGEKLNSTEGDVLHYCVVTYKDKDDNDQTLVLHYKLTEGNSQKIDRKDNQFNGIVIFEKTAHEVFTEDTFDKNGKNNGIEVTDVNEEGFEVVKVDEDEYTVKQDESQIIIKQGTEEGIDGEVHDKYFRFEKSGAVSQEDYLEGIEEDLDDAADENGVQTTTQIFDGIRDDKEAEEDTTRISYSFSTDEDGKPVVTKTVTAKVITTTYYTDKNLLDASQGVLTYTDSEGKEHKSEVTIVDGDEQATAKKKAALDAAKEAFVSNLTNALTTEFGGDSSRRIKLTVKDRNEAGEAIVDEKTGEYLTHSVYVTLADLENITAATAFDYGFDPIENEVFAGYDVSYKYKDYDGVTVKGTCSEFKGDYDYSGTYKETEKFKLHVNFAELDHTTVTRYGEEKQNRKWKVLKWEKQSNPNAYDDALASGENERDNYDGTKDPEYNNLNNDGFLGIGGTYEGKKVIRYDYVADSLKVNESYDNGIVDGGLVDFYNYQAEFQYDLDYIEIKSEKVDFNETADDIADAVSWWPWLSRTIRESANDGLTSEQRQAAAKKDVEDRGDIFINVVDHDGNAYKFTVLYVDGEAKVVEVTTAQLEAQNGSKENAAKSALEAANINPYMLSVTASEDVLSENKEITKEVLEALGIDLTMTADEIKADFAAKKAYVDEDNVTVSKDKHYETNQSIEVKVENLIGNEAAEVIDQACRNAIAGFTSSTRDIKDIAYSTYDIKYKDGEEKVITLGNVAEDDSEEKIKSEYAKALGDNLLYSVNDVISKKARSYISYGYALVDYVLETVEENKVIYQDTVARTESNTEYRNDNWYSGNIELATGTKDANLYTTDGKQSTKELSAEDKQTIAEKTKAFQDKVDAAVNTAAKYAALQDLADDSLDKIAKAQEEVSKLTEKLGSLNEELPTLNAELKDLNVSLADANDRLKKANTNKANLDKAVKDAEDELVKKLDELIKAPEVKTPEENGGTENGNGTEEGGNGGNQGGTVTPAPTPAPSPVADDTPAYEPTTPAAPAAPVAETAPATQPAEVAPATAVIPDEAVPATDAPAVNAPAVAPAAQAPAAQAPAAQAADAGDNNDDATGAPVATGETTEIGEEDTAKAATPETTEIGDEDTAKAAAPTEEMEDPETPLAALPEAAHMNWWWLLIVLVLGTTGAEMYRRHLAKKNAQTTTDNTTDKQ